MSEPTPERPGMVAGYGISSEPDGLLPWSRVDAALTAARNYWISTTRPDGRPHAAPVWGLWFDRTFWFGADPGSVKAANLTGAPEVVVHLESGDDVVIVHGTAAALTPDEILEHVRRPYEEKYGIDVVGDAPGEGYFRIVPHTVLAWLEASYPTTATRFRLDN